MIQSDHPTATALVSFLIGGVFGASMTAILAPRGTRAAVRRSPRPARPAGASRARVPEPGLPTTTSAYVSHH